MEVSILPKWAWKNTLAPAITGFVSYFLLMLGFGFGLWLDIGSGFPWFYVFLLAIITVNAIIWEWTDYPENVTRVQRFKAVFGADALTITQPVFWRERWYASHITYRYHPIFFKHVNEVVAEPTATIAYKDISSVFIKRGIWDKFYGMSKIVIILKNERYSTLNPPTNSFFGQDFVGDSMAASVAASSQPILPPGRIIVIPGLSEETARNIQDKIGASSAIDKVNTLPKAFKWSSVFIALGIFFLVVILLIWFMTRG